MASASSSSARSLFSDSKRRLAERVQVNVQNAASVARQVARGSRSSEILMHAARNFALQDTAIENSAANLKKMTLVVAHLKYQHEAIAKAADQVEETREQVRAMER